MSRVARPEGDRIRHAVIDPALADVLASLQPDAPAGQRLLVQAPLLGERHLRPAAASGLCSTAQTRRQAPTTIQGSSRQTAGYDYEPGCYMDLWEATFWVTTLAFLLGNGIPVYILAREWWHDRKQPHDFSAPSSKRSQRSHPDAAAGHAD